MSAFKICIGFVVAFLVGASTRWFNLPAPAPPTMIGALLIVAITIGYISTDKYLEAKQETEQDETHTEQLKQSSKSDSQNIGE